MRARLLTSLGSIAVAATALAGAPKTTALGTFTVAGKTIQIRHAVATRYTDPDDPSQYYLEMLMSDGPIAEADRTPARLLDLAKGGSLHALRLLWKEGYDSISVTPYDGQVSESGVPVTGAARLDLQQYDEKTVKAQVSSKMLGQDWQFNVRLEAPVGEGGALPAQLAEAPLALGGGAEKASGGSAPAGDRSHQVKVELGQLGYEYTSDSFVSAVVDGNLQAVKLFLEGGMSPNTKEEGDRQPLFLSATMCQRDPIESREPIIRALLAAGAKVNVRNENDSTPLLESVSGCPLPVIEALIAAGADVNARAKGGATPLMMAEVFQKADIAAALRKAGAKK